MRLPDFIQDEDLNRLRRKMRMDGLGDLHLSSAPLIKAEERDRLTSGVGIDVSSLSEVEVLSDGTLVFKGQRVLLYIRDVTTFGIGSLSDNYAPKYHLCDCRTLKEMRSANRIERYVVAAREDGRFLVNFVRGSARADSKVLDLRVCQNCLATLAWDGFSYALSKVRRSEIVKSFAPKLFFERYPFDLISGERFDREKYSPLNGYAEDFYRISASLKRQLNYRCEECGTHLDQRSLRRFLHVHHISGRKDDNRRQNLKVLCIECHCRQPGHRHMARMPELSEYRRLR